MHRLLYLLLALFFFINGCSTMQSPAPGNGANDQAVLKIGITTNAPPLAYRENGKITGLEAEFARGLAAYLGREAKFVELKWEDQIPALLKGKTDIIMSAMTITEPRQYQVAFCAPYMVTGQIPLVRLKDYLRFSDGFPALLNPKVKVGTVKGTTGDYLVSRDKAKGVIIRYGNALQGVQGVLDQSIDAFVYDLPMNLYYGAKYTNQGLTPVTVPMTREFIAWAVRKDDGELLSQANGYLNGLKTSGRLRQMIVRWIPFYEQVYNRTDR